MELNNHSQNRGRNKQTETCGFDLVDAKGKQTCAGCGQWNPEYALDDKPLCLDCYRAEKALLE
jgi:hypothetical protein